MISPQPYVPVPTPVEAVQVTAENAAEVAEWCDGEVVRLAVPTFGALVALCVGPGQVGSSACLGEWVVKGPWSEVLPDDEFRRRYRPAEEK